MAFEVLHPINVIVVELCLPTGSRRSIRRACAKRKSR